MGGGRIAGVRFVLPVLRVISELRIYAAVVSTWGESSRISCGGYG